MKFHIVVDMRLKPYSGQDLGHVELAGVVFIKITFHLGPRSLVESCAAIKIKMRQERHFSCANAPNE